MPELGLHEHLHLQVMRLQCCLEKALVDAKLGFIAAYVTFKRMELSVLSPLRSEMSREKLKDPQRG